MYKMSQSRAEELLFYAFDWASCCGADTWNDLVIATDITEEELDYIGIDSSWDEEEEED